MRKIYEIFGNVNNFFETYQKQMEQCATELVNTIIKNDDTKRCGELIEERLRIKSENSFTGNIEIVVVDKIIYNEEKGILVYDEDGGVLKWEELYLDDKLLLANSIYLRFKEDFIEGLFDVCVDGKSVLDESVDYLTAYEIQNEYKAKNVGYVGIDEL